MLTKRAFMVGIAAAAIAVPSASAQAALPNLAAFTNYRLRICAEKVSPELTVQLVGFLLNQDRPTEFVVPKVRDLITIAELIHAGDLGSVLVFDFRQEGDEAPDGDNAFRVRLISTAYTGPIPRPLNACEANHG